MSKDLRVVPSQSWPQTTDPESRIGGTRSRRRFRRSGHLMLAPLLLFLIIFFVLPVVMSLAVGFFSYDPSTFITSEFTTSNYTKFLSDPFYLDSFVLGFRLAGITTLISMVLGFPVAYHLHSLRSRFGRGAVTMLVFLPLMLSLVITAFAWLVVLKEDGLVNEMLRFLGLIREPLRLYGVPLGVVIVMIYQYIPYMILSIHASLENIDGGIVGAARSLGASKLKAFWEITVPLSVPGIVSGMLLVFALSIGAFITPLVIGAGRVLTPPVHIYQLATFVFDWPAAGALSGMFLVATLVATYFLSMVIQRRFLRWVT